MDSIYEMILKGDNMKERYAFIFYYEGDWMIVLYEDGDNTKYFNSSKDEWDDSLDYVDMFLENGGNKYYYKLPSFEYVCDLDVFNLKNHPIEPFNDYLLK